MKKLYQLLTAVNAMPFKDNMKYHRFGWNDVVFILCSTRQECRQLYEDSEELCRYIGLQEKSILLEKLRSFEEIDADY